MNNQGYNMHPTGYQQNNYPIPPNYNQDYTQSYNGNYNQQQNNNLVPPTAPGHHMANNYYPNSGYAQIQPTSHPSNHIPQPMQSNIPNAFTNSYQPPQPNGKSCHPEPILMTSGQQYPMNNAFPGQYSQNYKDPQKTLTLNEWENSMANINLSYDKNILPSDGMDCAKVPNINTKINCDPNLLRCTLTSIPYSASLLSKSRLPLGLIVQPFRDLRSLCVLQTKNIVRCRSCRTYINPFVQFRDSGRRWQCSVCLLNNPVPDDFFYDPVTKYHGDPTRRPEIKSTTVEYIATSEYNNRPPQAPTYVFCLNANREAVISGALTLACERIAAKLMNLPGTSRRQVAIITFDSAIHFYKIDGEYPKEYICPDVDDVFIPDQEGMLCSLESGLEKIEDLLTQIPQIFANTQDTGNCLGATLKIAHKLIAKIGGRITVVNCSMPNIGPGLVANREEPGDGLQPDARKLQPANDFYKTLGLECAQTQVAVDMFSLNSQYSDLATISSVARHSSGHLFYYPNFAYIPTTQEIENMAVTNPEEFKRYIQNIENWKTAKDGWLEAERFKRDFDRYLSRRIGFDAVMRTRYTRGLSIKTFHGSQFIRSVDLLSLPNLSPDAGFGIEFEIAEEITDPYIIIQVALLYTSSKCDRRIRVHTLCLPVVRTIGEVFMGADQGAIAALLGKMAVERCLTSSLNNAREALINALSDAVLAYHKETNKGKGGISSVILPANLRLLPLYIMGLLKCTAFRNHIYTKMDDRSAALEYIKCSPICSLLPYIYPVLYPLDKLYVKDEEMTLLERVGNLELEDTKESNPNQEANNISDSDFDTASSSESDESQADDAAQGLVKSKPNIPIIGPIRLSSTSIRNEGVYLLDQGQQLIILANMSAHPDVLFSLFGIESFNKFPKYGLRSDLVKAMQDKTTHHHQHPTRKALRRLISSITHERYLGNALFVMRQDGPTHMKSKVLSSMLEDRSETAMSFTEFLQSIEANCNK